MINLREDNINVNFIFKDLKFGINKNFLWLVDRHKHCPRSNNMILKKVMDVTSGKHSEHDNETAYFVICTLLERLRYRKKHRRNERAFWRVGQCRHQTDNTANSRLDVCHLVIQK